jgi:hypothetical protein
MKRNIKLRAATSRGEAEVTMKFDIRRPKFTDSRKESDRDVRILEAELFDFLRNGHFGAHPANIKILD